MFNWKMRRASIIAVIGVVCAATGMAYWDGPLPSNVVAASPATKSSEPAARLMAAPGVSSTAADTPPSFSFKPLVLQFVHRTASAVAIGDVTGDGLHDIVVATRTTGGPIAPPPGTGSVWIYAQNPDGSSQAPLVIPFQAGADVGVGLVLGDLNNDAIADIVVQHAQGITLLVADGAGGFKVNLQPGAYMTGYPLLAVADIDLDGNLDILHGTSSASTLYLGDGQGGIRGSRTLEGGDRQDLKLADVTGDGLPDLVVSVISTGDLIVYPHDGVDGFGPPRVYPKPHGWWGAGLTIADFNGDGRNDVAIGEHKNTPTQVWMLFQDANGNLLSHQSLPSYDNPGILLAHDLDRDGRDDLVVVHTGWSSLGFYLQGESGMGGEQRIDNLQTQMVNPHGLAAGDVDGDGCGDVAFVSEGYLHLLYGQDCHPLPPAGIAHDIDGDRRSDLLWRTDDNMHWAYWIMHGAVRTDGMSYAIGAGWRIVARGDFTGDGRTDLIWSDGIHMQMWQRDDAGYRGISMRDYPAGYRVVASGDIDGDGKADLAWRDDADTLIALWRMDGAEVIDGRNFKLPPGWRVAGSGDLDGDRRLDLVVTDDTRMVLWSGKANLTFVPAAMGGYPLGWALVGLSDVDADGTSNLLWRHAAGGYFVHWNMRGPRRVSGTTFHVDGSWRVIDTGDFDGNGAGDVLWSNGELVQLWASLGDSFAGWTVSYYPHGWSVIPDP